MALMGTRTALTVYPGIVGMNAFLNVNNRQSLRRYFGVERTNIGDASTLSTGKHVIKYEFIPDTAKPGTGGKCMLFVDGEQVAEGHIPKTVPFIFS